MLDVYVGEHAKKVIEEHGFEQSLFEVFLGASGGPKWFTLFGLDKYLFGEYFKNRNTPLDMVGSSAGAFRAACFAQPDPVAAITELGMRYSATDYQGRPSAKEITQSAIDMTEHLFSEQGVDSIINNPIFRPHFIVAKTKGFVGFENKLLQGAGLIKSILLNRAHRSFLNVQYERFVFKPPTSDLQTIDEYCITTKYQDFNSDNVKPSLLASGAIPYVMRGIKIPHAPKGLYRDGGVVDYHFDLQFNRQGLTLYPHFSHQPKAGWFDKNLERPVNRKNYSHTVLLTPSQEFIGRLPYGKIPDRKDFENIGAKERLSYWRTVLSETDRLADSFASLVETNDLSRLKPLPF
ncbi:MAG: patatin-like phospholipase family protein [Gammaproteobacteria bacterium]|nr:patatin-like phospholipase family protein [Gammaproteobacteria bacterium]